MHLIGKSLVMRTRAATEGRPYTGSGVGAGLRATAVRLWMNRVLGFSVMKFAVGPFSRWEKVDPERSERAG